MHGKRAALGLGLVAVASGAASAHQTSSPTENNRYAKVTVLPDTVRIAYTVIFGEQPGAMERRRMDANRDGQISDEEKRTYANELTSQIAPRLVVEVDGKPAAAAWRLADLGLGLPIVNAGSFALDLVLVTAVPDPAAAEHDLWFEDRWPVPNPGETDVRIEESPGCHLLESHVRRDARGIQKMFTFKGAGATAEDRGIRVRWGVDEALRHAPSAPKGSGWTARKVAPLVVLAVLAVFVGLGVAVRLKKR